MGKKKKQQDKVLPIYQGLLDEVDAGTRETVIRQQGEGINHGDSAEPLPRISEAR